MGYLTYDLGMKTIALIIVMIYLTIIGTLFLIKAKKAPKEVPSTGALFRAMTLVLYLYIAARFFFILSDYERDPHGETTLYFRFVALSYICGIFGYLGMMYVFEKYIYKKTKFFLTYFVIIMLVVDMIMIFFPDLMGIVRYINYGLFYFEGAVLYLLYIYVFRNTTGKLRKNALIAIIGLVIIAIAAILESDDLISSGLVLPYYSPILFAIGVTVFAYSQRGI